MRRFSNPSNGQRVLLIGALAAVLGCPLCPLAAYGQSDGGEAPNAELAALFADFLHFSRLGKFTEAEAYAEKLLATPDLDPVTVLVLADRDKDAVPTLITLIRHTSIAEPAQRVLDVIREGEFMQRQDKGRIKENVSKLGGPPQMEFNAIQRLKDSGEYAIPDMIAVLSDASKEKLWQRIIRALPQIGKPAVSPLVAALDSANPDVQRSIIWALGEIGYPQAVPFLVRLLGKENLPSANREAAYEAIAAIQGTSGRERPASAAQGFVQLADQYYREHGAVKADPRVPRANVWFANSDSLRRIEVPTEVYGAVMAMRMCEYALQLEPDNSDALALWIAANFRREARLGMDVENGEPDAGADADATRPEGFPRSIYFARAAGPKYCHLVLGRAVKDGDKQVALGAIAALDVVAGAMSLIGDEDFKQPLADALRFPDAEVRIKAAIALTHALPKREFRGADVVGHVLAEALLQQDERPQYVVACRDADNLNRIAGELRSLGADVIAEREFYAAMQRVRNEAPAVRGFVFATDLESPPITTAAGELRGEYRFARVPMAILVKPGQEHRAEYASTGNPLATSLDIDATAEEIRGKLEEVAEKNGAEAVDSGLAISLALRAAEALRLAALDGRTVISVGSATDALITALSADDPELRIAAAKALALVPSSPGQQGICDLAMNDGNDPELRIAAFDVLAESARRHGNQLTDDRITALVAVAKSDSNLALRTAASQALGALNLERGEASEIIRSHHRG